MRPKTPTTKTLFEIWQEHRDNKTCDKEFYNWNDFRAWFINEKATLDDVAQLTMLSKDEYNKLLEKAADANEPDVPQAPAEPQEPTAPQGSAEPQAPAETQSPEPNQDNGSKKRDDKKKPAGDVKKDGE